MRARLVEDHWIPRWLGVEAIVLYPWLLVAKARGQLSPALLAHEMTHYRQIRSLGIVRFYLRYLREYLAGRGRGLSHQEAYREISFEREAFAGGAAWRDSSQELRALAKELGLDSLYEERLAAHVELHRGQPS